MEKYAPRVIAAVHAAHVEIVDAAKTIEKSERRPVHALEPAPQGMKIDAIQITMERVK